MHASILAIVAFVLAGVASPAPPQRCFRAVQSERERSYVVLRTDASYERIEIDGQRVLWLDKGKWQSLSPRAFRLTSDVDAWALETQRLCIAPDRIFNVPLVAQLKEKILHFLKSHQGENTFSYDQVYVLEVAGGPCPSTDSYVCRGPCDGPWHYGVNTQPRPEFPDEPITRAQLLKIARMIDSYTTRTDLNVFQMYLLKDSGFTVAYFDRSGTGFAFRKASEGEIRQELRNALRFGGGDSGQPSSLVEVPCSSIKFELLPLLAAA